MGAVKLLPADDVIGCPFPFFEGIFKIYNDGGHYIATRVQRNIDTVDSVSVRAKKRTKAAERYLYANAMYKAKKRNEKDDKMGAEVIALTTGSGTPHTGVDILFDSLYTQAQRLGLKDTKTEKPLTDFIRDGILDIYEDTEELRLTINQHRRFSFGENFEGMNPLDAYIARKIKRKANNLVHRKKRFRRKAYMNNWNYFVTFTFDDAKHTAETFKKKLRKCLSNLHTRRGWKYMGVFELSPEKGRLHFHGLLYVPDGQMVGKITEKQDYSLSEHKMQVRNENGFFEESFGRNDFKEVSKEEMRNGKSIEYILKYIGKTNERICYSRGIPTEICKEIDERDIVTAMQDFVWKFILFDDVVDWERDVMKLRTYKQMTITDALCNMPLSA